MLGLMAKKLLPKKYPFGDSGNVEEGFLVRQDIRQKDYSGGIV